MSRHNRRFSVALLAVPAALGCSGRVVDLGNSGAPGGGANSTPIYAREAPSKPAADVATIPIVDVPYNVESFGLDGEDLYWVANPDEPGGIQWTLFRCSLANCAGTLRALTSATSNGFQSNSLLESVLFDEDSVYFEWRGNLDKRLMRCSKADCAVPEAIDLGYQSGRVVLQAGRLHWVSNDVSRHSQCQASACAATMTEGDFVAPPGEAKLRAISPKLTADGEALYFEADRRILRAPLDDALPCTVIARDEAFVGGIAVDAESIYWAESVPYGAVKSCSKYGCQGVPQSIVTNLASPSGVEVDAAHLYVNLPAETASSQTHGPYGIVPGTGRLDRYSLESGALLRNLAADSYVYGAVQFSGEFAYFLQCRSSLVEPPISLTAGSLPRAAVRCVIAAVSR